MRPALVEISGRSCWRVWVADTAEVNGPRGGVGQWSKDIMMNGKMSLFPILQYIPFSFPWSLLLLRWHHSWRCRVGKVTETSDLSNFPFSSVVLLMRPGSTMLGVPLSGTAMPRVPYSWRLSFCNTFIKHLLSTYHVHQLFKSIACTDLLLKGRTISGEDRHEDR